MSARCWEQPPRNCRKSSIFLQGFVTDHLPPSPPIPCTCARVIRRFPFQLIPRARFLVSPSPPPGRSVDENHLAGFGRSDKKIGKERERESCLQPVINLTSTPAAIVSSFLRFADGASIDHHPVFFTIESNRRIKRADVKSSHGVSIHLFARV